MNPAPLARIDMAAVRHNLARVREAAPGRRVIAVVKADGYGHGMARVVRALDGADAFAVARLDEALALREVEHERRVVLLPGVVKGAEIECAAAARIDLVAHSEAQVAALEAAAPPRPVDVWLKVDTGMHRMGVPPAAARGLWERLGGCTAVAGRRLMTHFAQADDRAAGATARQIRVFAEATAGIETERSLANSAGVLAWPDGHADWVRPGLMLYGISPFPGSTARAEGLRPAMTLETRLVAVNRIPAGGSIGYGGTWTCPEDMPVGVAAAGYADGYLRSAGAGTPALVDGRRAPLVGRVSMDTITLDLRGHPGARAGDPVVLWGEGLPVEEVAAHMGTIPYECVTGVAPRVARMDA